jgi:hypothetical protein
MYSNPLVVVPILFGLSMLAAVILFKFFQATAFITTKEYQLGGAIAGFVIVYLILNSSYNTISGAKDKLAVKNEEIEQMNEEIEQMKEELEELRKYSAAHYVEGVVDPYSEKTKVILAVTETDLPINKQFRLSAPCIDPSKGRLALYILKEGRVYPYEIFPNEDLTKVNVKVPR